MIILHVMGSSEMKALVLSFVVFSNVKNVGEKHAFMSVGSRAFRFKPSPDLSNGSNMQLTAITHHCHKLSVCRFVGTVGFQTGFAGKNLPDTNSAKSLLEIFFGLEL